MNWENLVRFLREKFRESLKRNKEQWENTKRALWTIAAGWGVIVIVFGTVVVLTQYSLFLAPEYKEFWKDLQDYHLKTESAKTREQMIQEYSLGRIYIHNVSLSILFYLPSDKAALTGVIIHCVAYHEKLAARKEWAGSVWAALIFGLIVMYLPMVISLRSIQRIVANWACKNTTSQRVTDDYFYALDKRRRNAVVCSLGLTLFLVIINAWMVLTPELQAKGLQIQDLAAGLLCVAYFGGFWLLVVEIIVDLLFLRAGWNPHYSLWDDAIAILLMVPVLAVVFQNSWLSVLTTVVGGLGAGVYLKWSLHRNPISQRD